MAGITQIDLERQSQDATLNRAKLKANFLEGSNLNLTDGNNNATLTGLANGVNPTDAVTKQQLDALVVVGGMTYIGVIDASDATGATLDGASKGDFYYVSVAGTLDGKAYSVGDHLIVNADITDFSVDGAGKIDIVDNTESLDILRDSDIVNDLTTGGASSVLSAQQGVVLKGLVDGLQTELDDTQAGAGLNTDGTYTANGAANYISTAVSLKDADNKLDAQIKVNTDAIAALGTEVWSEAPVVTDGVATVTLANTPLAGTERVYLNGMRQLVGGGNDYTIAGAVITFSSALKNPKDTVLVDYKF